MNMCRMSIFARLNEREREGVKMSRRTLEMQEIIWNANESWEVVREREKVSKYSI